MSCAIDARLGVRKNGTVWILECEAGGSGSRSPRGEVVFGGVMETDVSGVLVKVVVTVVVLEGVEVVILEVSIVLFSLGLLHSLTPAPGEEGALNAVMVVVVVLLLLSPGSR
jgi:hypothetical protein